MTPSGEIIPCRNASVDNPTHTTLIIGTPPRICKISSYRCLPWLRGIISPYSSHIPFIIITLLVNCIKEFLISRRLKAGIRGKRRNYRVHEILFLRRPQGGGSALPASEAPDRHRPIFSSASPKRLRRLKIFEARYSYFLTSKNIPSQNPRISRTKKHGCNTSPGDRVGGSD